MRRIQLASTFLVIALAAFLSGCGSVGDILGGGSRTDDPYRNVTNVRGTVERVDTRERYIVVDSEDTQYNLRNGQGGEVLVYYDDRTTVEHQGQTHRPQDLEPGDRILAEVNDSGGRLYADEIQVLYDVTSGTTDDRYDDRYGDTRTDELRGTVRNNDTRNRTLEILASRYGSNFSSGQTYGNDVVRVRYDANTIVEFEGRRYTADNLERGDLVEIEVRHLGGEMIAQEILVLGENQPVGR